MLSLALLLAISFIYSAYSADEPVVVVIGDSWGAYGWHDFQKVLKEKGSNLTVVSYAIGMYSSTTNDTILYHIYNKYLGGTTTKFWARDPDLVTKLVGENPTAEYVWLSIGGNDVIDFMPDCTKKMSTQQCIDIILPECMNNTKAFLDPLVAAYPDIKIVQFGYDIPQLGENALCRSIGETIIDGCNDTASCINPQFVKIQSLYVDQLGQDYKQLTAVNLLGSLQAQDNYPGVSVTNPDLTKWSPADLMETNCIHPTRYPRGNEPAGFDVIFNNLWAAYFAKQ